MHVSARSSLTHSNLAFDVYICIIYTSTFLYIRPKFAAFKGRRGFLGGPVQWESVEAQLKIMTAWDPSVGGGVKEESAAQPWQPKQEQITADTGTNLVMCSTTGWRELRAGGAADKKHASRDEFSLGCWSCFCEVDICPCRSTDRAAIYKSASRLVIVSLSIDETGSGILRVAFKMVNWCSCSIVYNKGKEKSTA